MLLPLAIVPRTRMFAGLGIYGTSWLFGLNLWVGSVFFAYFYWGLFPVILGLLFVGIGVFPIAVLALLWHGDWSSLGGLAEWLTLTLIVRFVGLWIAYKGERRAALNAET